MTCCTDTRPHRSHRGCQGVLSPDDERLVAQFATLYDLATLGPWWHQAAGHPASPVDSDATAATSCSPPSTP